MPSFLQIHAHFAYTKIEEVRSCARKYESYRDDGNGKRLFNDYTGIYNFTFLPLLFIEQPDNNNLPFTRRFFH